MRLAIVGAGPAGIYAADLLIKAERDFHVDIDIFEQLPAPYGLVRYGVAPDHPRIKGIVSALREVLDTHGDSAVSADRDAVVRLFGNVHYGSDITLDDLKRHYHAVIFATGAIRDADLNIDNIDAQGSFGAADFVSWFDGHPDVPREWPLTAKQAAVVGNGNVALDVARMLIKHAKDQVSTEVPANVLDGLRQNAIEEVHVFGRRGPHYVKFTPLELRELGEVPDVDVVLDERDFSFDDPYATETLMRNKQVMVIDRIFRSWIEAQQHPTSAPASRRLVLHFWSKPVAVETDDEGKVSGLVIERTEPDGEGGVRDTGVRETVAVQSIYRAVGYFGSPLEEVPFDEHTGVIPNEDGRVLAADGHYLPGVYTTGWIKRGPVGLIGHTKSDAMQTLECLLADQATWWQPEQPDPQAIVELLSERHVAYTTIEGWARLDEHERALGESEGRERIKIVGREEMVRISRGE